MDDGRKDVAAQSEARFRLMADSVPHILWATDASGKVEFFNKQWFAYTGSQAEPDSASQVAADHVHPDDVPPTLAAFEAARASATVFAVEHRIRSARGDYRWFLVRAEPYRDPSTGQVVRWYGSSIDIHDRRLAEVALRELNERLDQQIIQRTAERDRIWDASPDLMVVVDLAGVFRRVNPAWTTLLEYTSEDLVGHYVNEFVLMQDHPETTAAFALAAQGRQSIFENRCYHKNGAVRWISWTAARAERLIYATGRDITAQKAAQAALEEAESRRRAADALYRAYFENTAEALFVVGVLPDGGFRIEDLNPAHQASIGFALKDVFGKRVDQVLPPETSELVIAHYRHVLSTGQVYQYRDSFDLHGVSTHWDTVLVPVRDASGVITKLIGSSRNLTAQVAAEEQLRQAQKMEAMGQLTGGVAHDFNNVLTPIIGALDILQRRRSADEPEQRLIANALQAAERAKTLVQRLLAFARRQPIKPTKVDLAELTRGMADLIASTTGPQIRSVLDAPPGLPAAQVDSNQLEMALLNLAVNARDAMPDGGTLRISVDVPDVEIERPPSLKPGKYLRLSVADTGTGMDHTTAARAVEPFFSTKGVGRGTGLGLSMVHGLAGQLGGALTIKSLLGVGTNVELWLPQSDDTLQDDVAVPRDDVRLRRGSALLVDDEDLVRQSTASMLRELGYDVLEAASADDALSIVARGTQLDLVITDYLMPGVNGAELARSLNHRAPNLPVLIITGYADTEGMQLKLPMLAKPFRTKELAESIDVIMGLKES